MKFFVMILFFFILLIFEVLFFWIAKKYDIVDKPNHRSSHSSVTIRGGGIIFSISVLVFFFAFGFQYPFFMLGLVLISLISFLDDIFTLKNLLRISVHLIAVGFLFYQLDVFGLGWYWIPILIILVIGSLNAYNFMDGINGITGAYSLLTIGTLYYINQEIIVFTLPELLLIIAMSLLIFNFFNFRKSAVCFAGDVGSIGIAFAIVFLIGQLIFKTHNFNYILLLLLYGIDTGSTIIFRILRKENIFEAHKSHFYQYLSSQRKWPHLVVSLLYISIQGAINIILIQFIGDSMVHAILVIIIAFITLIVIRICLEGRFILLGR